MRDECRDNRKTWRWKNSGVSVKTFSTHVVVVLRLIVSRKRFSTHGRVRGNRKIGEKKQSKERKQRDRGRRENREIRKKTEETEEMREIRKTEQKRTPSKQRKGVNRDNREKGR